MYGEVGLELLGLACYGSGSGVLIAPAPPPTVRSDSYEVHKSHGLGSIIYFFIPQKAVGNSEMTMFNNNFNSPVEPRVRRRRGKPLARVWSEGEGESSVDAPLEELEPGGRPTEEAMIGRGGRRRPGRGLKSAATLPA